MIIVDVLFYVLIYNFYIFILELFFIIYSNFRSYMWFYVNLFKVRCFFMVFFNKEFLIFSWNMFFGDAFCLEIMKIEIVDLLIIIFIFIY